MIFKIRRIDANEHSTVSEMEINGKTYFILEDTIRNIADKIYGETAIPYGKYKLSLVKYGSLHNWLSTHKLTKKSYKGVILLSGVKGFNGVCFHPGATVKNTEGCLLPTLKYSKIKHADGTEEFTSDWDSSYQAYVETYKIIVDSILKEDTYFEIINDIK